MLRVILVIIIPLICFAVARALVVGIVVIPVPSPVALTIARFVIQVVEIGVLFRLFVVFTIGGIVFGIVVRIDRPSWYVTVPRNNIYRIQDHRGGGQSRDCWGTC